MNTRILLPLLAAVYALPAGAVVTKDCPKAVTLKLSAVRAESRAKVAKDLDAQKDGAVNGIRLETLLQLQDQLGADTPSKALRFTLKDTTGSACAYRTSDKLADFGLSAYLAGTFAGNQTPNFSVTLWPRDARLAKEVRKLDFSLIVKRHDANGIEVRDLAYGISAYGLGQCDPENGADCGSIYLGSVRADLK